MHKCVALLFALSLTACATITDEAYVDALSAAPLKYDEAAKDRLDQQGTLEQKKGFLADIVTQSVVSCTNFSNRLLAMQSSTDITADILSTTLTALGTAIKPVQTVHALTAASTIVSGAKTSIDANLFAKASVANLQTAIAKTYGTHMQAYNDALPALDNNMVFRREIATLTAIHAQCGLGFAQSAIDSTLNHDTSGGQPEAAPAAPQGTGANRRARPGRGSQRPLTKTPALGHGF